MGYKTWIDFELKCSKENSSKVIELFDKTLNLDCDYDEKKQQFNFGEEFNNLGEEIDEFIEAIRIFVEGEILLRGESSDDFRKVIIKNREVKWLEGWEIYGSVYDYIIELNELPPEVIEKIKLWKLAHEV